MQGRALAIVAILAGCGRIAFDPIGDGGGAGGDRPDLATCPVLETVMSGDLVIAATETGHDAMITLPLDRTLLVTTMREIEPSPSFGLTRCELRADRVHCERSSAGTDYIPSMGKITIHWIAATFAAGVTVQRGVTSTSTTNPQLVPLTEVPLDESFIVLTGSSGNSGLGWGDNEYVRARLLDGHTLELATGTAGTTIGWQVVRMAGAHVDRGMDTIQPTVLQKSVGLPSTDTSRSFVLSSYTLGAGSIAVPGAMARATLVGNGMLRYQRQASGPQLDFAWELITPPFALSSATFTISNGTAQFDVPVTGFTPATSFAMTSAQGLLGPSGGDTNFNGSGNENDLVGEAMVTLEPSAVGLLMTREAFVGDATFDYALIDLAQPRCP